jgi:hypothetical protein
MKKIALFVEGETEAYFVQKLIKEIARRDSVSFDTFKGYGGQKVPRVFSSLGQSLARNEQYKANIYISSTDNRVNQDIIDQMQTLKASGFNVIVGLRDIRGQKNDGTPITLADLPNLETANARLFASESNVFSLLAVMEIETWFISEVDHFQRISSNLTEILIKANIPLIGVDLYNDDLTQINEPAETLNKIYNLIGESYDKSKVKRERTIDALDMANMYLYSTQRLIKFREFVDVLDSFLS